MTYEQVCACVGKLFLESQAREAEKEKKIGELAAALADATAERDALLRLMGGQDAPQS